MQYLLLKMWHHDRWHSNCIIVTATYSVLLGHGDGCWLLLGHGCVAFFSNTQQNCASLVLKIENMVQIHTAPLYIVKNCPYPRSNLSAAQNPWPRIPWWSRHAPAHLPPAWPAAPMACINRRCSFFFPGRAARSLPHNLWEEMELTYF